MPIPFLRLRAKSDAHGGARAFSAVVAKPFPHP
jgi:hypothetical protein